MSQFDNLSPDEQYVVIRQRPELQALNPDIQTISYSEQYAVELEREKQKQRSEELSKQVLSNKLDELVKQFKENHKNDLSELDPFIKDKIAKYQLENPTVDKVAALKQMVADDQKKAEIIRMIENDPDVNRARGYDPDAGRRYGDIRLYDPGPMKVIQQKYPQYVSIIKSLDAGYGNPAASLPTIGFGNSPFDEDTTWNQRAGTSVGATYGNVTTPTTQIETYNRNVQLQKNELSSALSSMNKATTMDQYYAAETKYNNALKALNDTIKTDISKITVYNNGPPVIQGAMTDVQTDEKGNVISVTPNTLYTRWNDSTKSYEPVPAEEINAKYMAHNGVVGDKWYQTPGQAISAGILIGPNGNAQYVNDLLKDVKNKLYVQDKTGGNVLNPKLSETQKQDLMRDLSAYESLKDYMYRKEVADKAEKKYKEEKESTNDKVSADTLARYISTKAALDTKNIDIKDIPLITQSAMEFMKRGFTADQAIDKSLKSVNATNYKIDLFNTGNNKLIIPNMKHVESISDLISTPQKIVNAKEEIEYKKKIANGILSEITINSQNANNEGAGAISFGDNVLNAKYIDTKHRFIPDLNTATYRFGFNEFGRTLDDYYGDGTADTVLNPKMGSKWTYNGDYRYDDGRVVSRFISNKNDIVDFGQAGVFTDKQIIVTGGASPGGYSEWINRNKQVVGNAFGSNLVQSSYKDIKTGKIITGPPTDFSLVRSSGEPVPEYKPPAAILATQNPKTVKEMYETLADQMNKNNIKEVKGLSSVPGVYTAPKVEINNISDLVTSGRMDTSEYKQSFLNKLPSELRNISFGEVYSIPTQETLNTPLAGREWKELSSMPGVYTTPLGKVENNKEELPKPYISNLGLLRLNDITLGKVPNTQENRDFVIKNLPVHYNNFDPFTQNKIINEKGASGREGGKTYKDEIRDFLEENKDTDFTKNTVKGANKPEFISGFGPAVALLGAAKMYDKYIVSPIDTTIRGYDKSSGEEAPPESPITTARSFAATSVSSIAAIPTFPIHVALEPIDTIKGLTIGQYESFQKRPYDTTADILGMVYGSKYVVKGGSKSFELATKGTGLVKEMIYPNPGSMMRTPGQLSELNTKLGGSIVRDMFEIKGDMEFTRGEKSYYPGPSMKLGSAVKEPTTIPGTFAAINVEPGTAYASPFTEGTRSPTGEIIRAPDAHYNIINAHTLYDIIPIELKNRINERISRQEDFPKEAAEVEKYANEWSNAHNGKPVAVFTGKLTHYKAMGYAQLEPEVFLIIGDKYSPESLRYQRTFAGYNQYGVPLYKTFIYDIDGKIPIEKSSIAKNLFENIKYNLQEGTHIRNVHEKNVLENFDEQFGLKPSYGEYKYIGNSPEFHTRNVEQTLLSMPEAKIYNTNVLRAAALIHDLAQIKPKGELEPYNTPHGEVVGNMLLQGKLDSRLAQIGISKLTQAEKIEVARAITLHDVIEPSTSGRYYKIAKTKLIDRPSPLAKMLITADRLDIERFQGKTYNNKLGYEIPSIPKTKGGEPLYGFSIKNKLSNMVNNFDNYFKNTKTQSNTDSISHNQQLQNIIKSEINKGNAPKSITLPNGNTYVPKVPYFEYTTGNKPFTKLSYDYTKSNEKMGGTSRINPELNDINNWVNIGKVSLEPLPETSKVSNNKEYSPKQFKDIYKYDKIYDVNIKKPIPNYYNAINQNKPSQYIGNYNTPKEQTIYKPSTYNPSTTKYPPTTYKTSTYSTPTNTTTYKTPSYNPPTYKTPPYNPTQYNPPTTKYPPTTYNPPQNPPTKIPPPTNPPKTPPTIIIPPIIVRPPKITEKNEKLFWKKRKKAKIIQVTTEEPILSGYQILTGENLPHQYGKYEEYNWKPPKVSKYIAKKGKTSTFKKRLQPEALVNKTMKKNGFNIPNTWDYNKAINKFGVSLPKTKDTYPIKKLKSKKK